MDKAINEYRKIFERLYKYDPAHPERFDGKSAPENRIHEIIGCVTSNKAKMLPLDETYPNRVILTHGEEEGKGYIVISASRYDLVPENEQGRIKKLDTLNYKRNNELLNFITTAGYSHTPCYGRTYEDNEYGKRVPVEERGFIVYNYKYNVQGAENIVRSLDALRSFGEQMCKTFNQDNFLYKESGNNAKWINRMGGIDKEWSKNVTINDMVAEYFTSLIKPNKNMTANGRKVRWNYNEPGEKDLVECFINPNPATRNERMSRVMKGELL
jgi:hypothetical protein